MLTLRRRPPFWVAAWLIFQGSALYALVPRDCCAAHKHGGDHQSAAHQAAPAPTEDHAHHGHQMAAQPEAPPAADATPARGCVMRGTCDGPMAAVLAVLSTQGVPPTSIFSIVPDTSTALIAGSTSEQLVSRLASPEPPPPRA